MLKRFLLGLLLFITSFLSAESMLARVHYSGGGDWYNNPDVLPNLAKFYNKTLSKETFSTREKKIQLTDAQLWESPFLYITGHGNVQFSDQEIDNLREYLINGGFLYIDDDYGLDKSIRREMKKLFPEKNFVEVSKNNEIFSNYFEFNDGLPKIHKHDEKRPQLFAIFDDYGRIMVLYTFESNISDGWASANVHKDPFEVRETALQFGFNILYYVLQN